MSSGPLEHIAGELSKLRAAGHSAVAIDLLLPYVQGLVNAARAADPEGERLRLQQHFDGQIEHYKASREMDREMFKAVIEAGQSALKSLSVINGAAAIALLAFLGNALSKDKTPAAALIAGMSNSMLSFGIGVALAGAGFALRYLSQAVYTGDFRLGTEHSRWGDRLRNAAILAGVGSLVAFIVGTFISFRTLSP